MFPMICVVAERLSWTWILGTMAIQLRSTVLLKSPALMLANPNVPIMSDVLSVWLQRSFPQSSVLFGGGL